MSKFSTHWLPSPALSCVSVFHLYICLFWLTVLMHTPLPWNIQTCQGWTLTNGPQHGASNTDSWIHTCVCPCRHMEVKHWCRVSSTPLLWGRVSQWTRSFPIGWTAGQEFSGPSCLPSHHWGHRNALPIPAHRSCGVELGSYACAENSFCRVILQPHVLLLRRLLMRNQKSVNISFMESGKAIRR